jgi:hypothetical protein
MTKPFREAAALLAAAFLLAAFSLTAPGCNKHQKVHVTETDTVEEAPRLASSVHMGDGTMAKQLASGFYDIEAGSWRWTQQQFAVNLRAPAHSAQQGAVLELHLTVPPPTIAKLGNITLSAAIGGTPLAPETYSRAGEYTYRRDVPANLLAGLAGDAVRIDFQLDKVMPQGDVDKRELGIVTSSVGLLSK